MRLDRGSAEPSTNSRSACASSFIANGGFQDYNNSRYTAVRIEMKIAIREAVAADAERIHEIHGSSVRVLCATVYTPEIIEEWRKDYNEVRPHSSLKGATPKEYAETTAGL